MSYSEWKTTKLFELINTVSETYKFSENQTVVLINTSDILEGKVLNHSKVFPINVAGQFKKTFKRNDILYSEIRPANKRYAYIDFESNNYVASTKLMVLRTKSKDIYNKFLYHFLKSNDTLKTLQAVAESRSGTFPQITFTELSNLEINLPTLKEQQAIANILSSLDDKIELNNKINKNLEELAQTLYKQWFVDFDFPNDDGLPYKTSGGEMVESKLGLIPKGWEVKELSDMAVVSSGKRPPIKVKKKTSEYKYPVIGASGVMAYTQEYNIDEKILSIGRVGTHGIVQRITEKVWVSDNTLTIKSNLYEFVYQILNQFDYKSLNRGSTQPLITQTDVNKIGILVPKNDLLKYFEKVVSSLFEVHKYNLIQNYKLAETRDLLLPKLMSGEIRVPIKE
ncbi:MAG: restriction endonuclease subunit S [Tissierellia bacterium]|nr:restriction endonuclease subunit S [Tissierellia bacterium]